MTTSSEPLTRTRATAAEMQRRLAIIALALRQGMPGSEAIRTAMAKLRMSRRTAQRCVRELQTLTRPRAKHASDLARAYQQRRAEEAQRSCASL